MEGVQPPLYLPQSWGRRAVLARLFTRSFEHMLDANIRDRAEYPSPRLGRVRVGLMLKNNFLPEHQHRRNGKRSGV